MALNHRPPHPAPADVTVYRANLPPKRHCLACLTQNSQGLEVYLIKLSAVSRTHRISPHTFIPAALCARLPASMQPHRFQSLSVLPVKPPADRSRIKPQTSLHQYCKQKPPAHSKQHCRLINKEFRTITISMPSMVQALFQA